MIELNWIDFIILIVLLYYAFEGYSIGFIGSLLALVSFILSFVIGLKYYGAIGEILVKAFSIPQGFSNAVGFFVASFLIEIVTGFLLRKFLGKKLISINVVNRLLGIVPGIFSGLVILTFLLLFYILHIIKLSSFAVPTVSVDKSV